MEPTALLGVGRPARRSFAGHVLALGVYVFMFGALAYLAFLDHGGLPGQLLLIYVSSLPLALAVGTLAEIAKARNSLSAHHAIAGCLNVILLCGVGGIWLSFREQLALTLVGSAVLVWATKYSPAAGLIALPSASELVKTPPVLERQSVRTVVMLLAAVVLIAAGVGLTWLAVVGQAERPGGLSITVGG